MKERKCPSPTAGKAGCKPCGAAQVGPATSELQRGGLQSREGWTAPRGSVSGEPAQGQAAVLQGMFVSLFPVSSINASFLWQGESHASVPRHHSALARFCPHVASRSPLSKLAAGTVRSCGAGSSLPRVRKVSRAMSWPWPSPLGCWWGMLALPGPCRDCALLCGSQAS